MGRGRGGQRNAGELESSNSSTPRALAPGRGTAERAERAQIVRSIRATPENGSGLRPIHAIRDHAEKTLGRSIHAFDSHIKHITFGKHYRMLELSDSRMLTASQMSRSIAGLGDTTFAWIDRVRRFR